MCGLVAFIIATSLQYMYMINVYKFFVYAKR